MKSRYSLILLGFLVGLLLAVPAAISGFEFIVANIATLTAAFVGLMAFLGLVAALLIVTKEQWTRWLFKTTEAQIESIADLISDIVRSAASGDIEGAISHGHKCARALLARYSIITLRKWIATTAIATLATFAGISTSALMAQQNALLRVQNTSIELQTLIAKQQVLPLFVIRANQLKEPNDNNFSQDKITVDNKGGIAYDIHCKVAVFLDVTLTPINPRSGPQIKRTFALNGYYSGTSLSPTGTGRLVTLEGYRNHERAIQLEREFRTHAQTKETYGSAELRRYVKISYRDQLDQMHESFYLVPLIYGAHHISNEEGEEFFSQLKDAFPRGQLFEFDKLTAAQLFDETTTPR